MTVRTSVLWKMKIHMAKKWPEKVVQRSFIKEHSFPNGLYFKIVRLNVLKTIQNKRVPAVIATHFLAHSL